MENKGGYSLMKNSHLKAVHDEDLESFLYSLGYYAKICNGECHCHFCDRTISMNNLGAILPWEGKVAFSCDSANCLQKMSEAGNNDDH